MGLFVGVSRNCRNHRVSLGFVAAALTALGLSGQLFKMLAARAAARLRLACVGSVGYLSATFSGDSENLGVLAELPA